MTQEELLYKIEQIENLQKTSQNEQAQAIALELLEQPILQEDKATLAQVIRLLGIVNMNFSNYSKASEYYFKALHINEEIDNKEGIASNLALIAILLHYLADYTQALDYYKRALSLNEELGNKSKIATALSNIGVVYLQINDYSKALEYLKKALQIYEGLSDKAGIAHCLGNIGLVLSEQEDTLNAIEYLEKSLSINQEIGAKRKISNNLGNLGSQYIKLSEYSKAQECTEKALVLNEAIGNKHGKAHNLSNLGRLCMKRSDYPKALEFLKSAQTLSEEIKTKNITVDILKEMSNCYELMGHIGEAFMYYKKSIDLDKEVQSEESANKARLFDQQRKIEEDERARQLKLARFQEQEKILLNILPSQIAERILEGEKRIANLHEQVSVFFSDIVGFTKLSQTISPDELLSILNDVFSEFDRLARKHGLEKIKTIGDAYMAVAGVPMAQEDHAKRAASFALDVIDFMKVYRKTTQSDLQIRVGLHCGAAIAGVIGENKFAYDLWGDAVNTASRMESHGEAGKIHISEDFKNTLGNSYIYHERGEIEVKGKGKMITYFLENYDTA